MRDYLIEQQITALGSQLLMLIVRNTFLKLMLTISVSKNSEPKNFKAFQAHRKKNKLVKTHNVFILYL